ncbi:hypothetical protein Ccrd_015705, partial [Cynara cardunculus var. scolymus]
DSSGSEDTAVSKAYSSKFSRKQQEKCSSSTNNPSHGFLFKRCISSSHRISLSWCSSKSLFSIASSGRDDFISEDEPSSSMMHKNELEFNRINCLVWVLHESARSFSLAIQTLKFTRKSPPLSNAWNGVDVAVYALLKAAIEVELFLSHKRCNSPVYEIKLGSGRLSCPRFTAWLDDALVELRDLSRDLVSVDKLHHLAIEAGFEEDFLSHFGKKVLPSKNIEDVEFWIGLVQEKLSVAFHRESLLGVRQPVVIDEIGWLDFYAPLKCKFQYDGRSRQHAIQAEKEIILYTVLTVCYDVFSGFAHYSSSSQRPLDTDLLSFLFRR